MWYGRRMSDPTKATSQNNNDQLFVKLIYSFQGTRDLGATAKLPDGRTLHLSSDEYFAVWGAPNFESLGNETNEAAWRYDEFSRITLPEFARAIEKARQEEMIEFPELL
jgi:hypothetical protein